MVTSIVIVALLGSLAGANAIIAPMIIPLVAIIGITPSTMAAVLMGAGITGLFIGPYSPQVVTIMSLTGMTYSQYIIQTGLPVAALCWVTTFICASRIQKKTKGVYQYELEETVEKDYVPSAGAKRATAAFAICMAAMIGYGIYLQSGSTYAILVISVTAIVTGLAGGIHPDRLFEVMIEGASKIDVAVYYVCAVYTVYHIRLRGRRIRRFGKDYRASASLQQQGDRSSCNGSYRYFRSRRRGCGPVGRYGQHVQGAGNSNWNVYRTLGYDFISRFSDHLLCLSGGRHDGTDGTGPFQGFKKLW